MVSHVQVFGFVGSVVVCELASKCNALLLLNFY